MELLPSNFAYKRAHFACRSLPPASFASSLMAGRPNHGYHILWIMQSRSPLYISRWNSVSRWIHISFKVRQRKAYLLKKCLQGSRNLKWLVSTAYFLFPVWQYRGVTQLLEPELFPFLFQQSLQKNQIFAKMYQNSRWLSHLAPVLLVSLTSSHLMRFHGCQQKVKNSWPLFPNIPLSSSFRDPKQKQTISPFNTQLITSYLHLETRMS